MAIFDWLTGKDSFRDQVRLLRERLPMAGQQDRFRLYDQLGDLCRDRLHDPRQALAAYVEALALQPEDAAMLQKVLDQYTVTEQWREAVSILERMALVEKDPRRKMKYYYTAGVILRDAVRDIPAAIRAMEAAVQLGPDQTIFSEALRKLRK